MTRDLEEVDQRNYFSLNEEANSSLTAPPDLTSAYAAKSASRAIARKTPEAVIKQLFARHRELALAKVERKLTRAEQSELDLVRWELDRIQDAQIGPDLDRFERLVELYEDLADEFKGALRGIDRVTKHKRRSQKR